MSSGESGSISRLRLSLAQAEALLEARPEAACDLLREAAQEAHEAQLSTDNARACELLGQVGLRTGNDVMAQEMFALAHSIYGADLDVRGAARSAGALAYLGGPRAFPGDDEAITAEMDLIGQLCRFYRDQARTEGKGGDAVQATLLSRRATLDLRYQQTRRQGRELSLDLLCRVLGLDVAARAVLLGAMAPALDESLARALREAQGDLSARAPSAWFLFTLCAPVLEAPVSLSCLDEDAPLRRYDLVIPYAHPDRPRGARAHALLDIDPDVTAFLHGRRVISLSIREHAAMVSVPENFLGPHEALGESVDRLERLLLEGAIRRVAILGPVGAGKKSLAAWIGSKISRRALCLDLFTVRNAGQSITMLRTGLRDALLHEALLVLDLGDGLSTAFGGPGEAPDAAEGAARYRGIDRALSVYEHPVFLIGNSPKATAPLISADTAELFLSPLSLDEQARHFLRALRILDAEAPPEALLRATVCQAGMTPGSIELSVRRAVAMARMAGPGRPRPTMDHLKESARAAISSTMKSVAQRIVTPFRLQDLIVPPETQDQLREMLDYVRNQSHVFGFWGFQRKVPYGRSVTTLFTGPPGTGKTMAASVIAAELGLDLFRIDLSQVVSKYIGETEKNLGHIFDSASEGHMVLLFDEADSLFAKRTDVKSSVDRYSNLEINFLLQRLESFEGIAILTTNLAKNIDEAFRRRLRFIIEFPFPDEVERAWLWRSMLPQEAEVRGEVPFDLLASFEMAGGNVKNSILRAAFAAAARGDAILPYDLVRGAIEEMSKMGKLSRDSSYLFEGLEIPAGMEG